MLAALVLAAACTPLTTYTPTPTLKWEQADRSNTVAYRAYWKLPGDLAWRGSTDFKVWPGDADSSPVWPGITIDIPAQRIYPTSRQGVEIQIVIKAVSPENVESAPSNVITICAPKICVKPGPCS